MDEEIISILMRRDGLDRSEAIEAIEEAQFQIDEIIEGSADLFEIEEVIKCELGLEPDFVESFIF